MTVLSRNSYLGALVLLLAAVRPAVSATYPLPPAGDDVIGQAQTTVVQEGDTLIDIARDHDLGYSEIVEANPGIDPWLPPVGAEIVLPTIHVLPAGSREGIVINLAEMRLYYFPAPKRGETPVVMTFPIGIGQEGWATPLGITKVVSKVENPTWYVPESIRTEHAEDGDILPAVVPPGPDNPLGSHALRLGWSTFLIHGTNKAYGVGMRVSHGCVRLYPEDIKTLFETVPVSTRVWVIDQPFKLGKDRDLLVLEVHPPISEPGRPAPDHLTTVLAAVDAVTQADERAHTHGAALEAMRRQLGVPEPIGGLKAGSQPALAVDGEGWMVQLGVFSDRRNASRMAKELIDLGAAVSLRTRVSTGYCHVLVGPYPDRDAAFAAREKFERATGYRGKVMPANREDVSSECLL